MRATLAPITIQNAAVRVSALSFDELVVRPVSLELGPVRKFFCAAALSFSILPLADKLTAVCVPFDAGVAMRLSVAPLTFVS